MKDLTILILGHLGFWLLFVGCVSADRLDRLDRIGLGSWSIGVGTVSFVLSVCTFFIHLAFFK